MRHWQLLIIFLVQKVSHSIERLFIPVYVTIDEENRMEGNQVDRFLSDITGRREPEFRIEDCLEGKRDFPSWKNEIREEVKRILRVDESPVCDILHSEYLHLLSGVSLSCQWYSFYGMECPCFVLEPEDVKGAVIAFAGHGHGIRNILGGEYTDSYMNDFPLALAKRGFIVYYPELLGYGKLRLSSDIQKNSASSCERLSLLLAAAGKTLLGMRVMQARSVMKIIRKEHPGLKISVMGISGGGTVASFLASLESDTLSSVVISGYAGCWEDSILRNRHCICNYVPGMLESFTLPSLLSSAAPLRMLWESGENDTLFPQKSTYAAEKTVREVYAKWGRTEDFVVDYFSGGHEIHGSVAYDFIERYSGENKV